MLSLIDEISLDASLEDELALPVFIRFSWSIDIFNLIIHITSFHFLGALDNPCSLSCMPKNEFFYQTFKEKVVDGTRCTEHSYDMCVDGVCMVNSKLNKLFLSFF